MLLNVIRLFICNSLFIENRLSVCSPNFGFIYYSYNFVCVPKQTNALRVNVKYITMFH